MRVAIGVSTIAVSLLLALPLRAVADDADPGYLPGAWHFKSITCVDSTVTANAPRPANAPGSSTIAFATGLGVTPLFAGTAHIVHYGGDPADAVIAAEHVGDRVQVCFLGGPAPTQSCDPDKDNRGRKYRVYDYKQQKQYWGYNSEHLCGGA